MKKLVAKKVVHGLQYHNSKYQECSNLIMSQSMHETQSVPFPIPSSCIQLKLPYQMEVSGYIADHQVHSPPPLDQPPMSIYIGQINISYLFIYMIIIMMLSRV